MTIDTWDPRQYDKFQREREQPFFELLKLVHVTPDMRVVDLGCGTGKLTRVLHERLQSTDALGIDRSESMLEGTQGVSQPAGLRFKLETIEGFLRRRPFPADRFDLIFSNAALHWIDDHESLMASMAAALKPEGQLAFQVPAQHADVTHRVAEEVAETEPFHSALEGWRRPQPVLAPDAYSRLLYRCGFEAPIVRLIVYPHVLPSRDAVVEWMKGTLLTEYARHLPADLFERFVEAYRARLLPQLDTGQPFFFPFKRILCWGQRSS